MFTKLNKGEYTFVLQESDKDEILSLIKCIMNTKLKKVDQEIIKYEKTVEKCIQMLTKE